MVPTSREIIAALFPVVTAALSPPPQAIPPGFLTPVPFHLNTFFESARSTAVLRQRSAARPRSSEGSSAWGTCMNIGLCSTDVEGESSAAEEPDGITKHAANIANSNRHTGGASDSLVDRRREPSGKSSSGGNRQWRGGQLLTTVPPILLAATMACSQASSAAVTGGRIGGGYTPPPERTPSAPPMEQQQRYQPPQQQQQQQYQPRAGRDIYGSDGSRFHIRFDGARGGRRSSRVRFDPDAGDVPSTTITPGDVVMIGGVSAGVAAVQRYNRKRFLEEEGQDQGRRSSPTLPARASRKSGSKQEAVVTSLQLSLYCDRKGGQGDLLATLDKLSQTADVNSPRGLSALINEVKDYAGLAIRRAQGSAMSRGMGLFCRDVDLVVFSPKLSGRTCCIPIYTLYSFPCIRYWRCCLRCYSASATTPRFQHSSAHIGKSLSLLRCCCFHRLSPTETAPRATNLPPSAQVCLALLRSDRDWIGGTGGIKTYLPDGQCFTP